VFPQSSGFRRKTWPGCARSSENFSATDRSALVTDSFRVRHISGFLRRIRRVVLESCLRFFTVKTFRDASVLFRCSCGWLFGDGLWNRVEFLSFLSWPSGFISVRDPVKGEMIGPNQWCHLLRTRYFLSNPVLAMYSLLSVSSP